MYMRLPVQSLSDPGQGTRTWHSAAQAPFTVGQLPTNSKQFAAIALSRIKAAALSHTNAVTKAENKAEFEEDPT